MQPTITRNKAQLLQDLENIAHAQLSDAIQAFEAFTETIDEIQASELWRAKAQTWRDYFDATFSTELTYGYKRYRQLVRTLPVRKTVYTETGYEMSERIARDVAARGYNEPDSVLPIVQAASRVAETLNEPLARRHIMAVIDTQEQYTETKTFDGALFASNGVDVELVAQVAESIETAKRHKQHKIDNSKQPRYVGVVSGTITTDDGQTITLDNQRVILIVKDSA